MEKKEPEWLVMMRRDLRLLTDAISNELRRSQKRQGDLLAQVVLIKTSIEAQIEPLPAQQLLKAAQTAFDYLQGKRNGGHFEESDVVSRLGKAIDRMKS